MNNVINDNCNPVFKSKIVFLSPEGMSKVQAKYKKNELTNIFNYNILLYPTNLKNCYRTKVNNGYTQGVRTCTACICADKGKKAALFSHVEDNQNNLDRFEILTPLINGTNAIIIGSKKYYERSCELFNKFVNAAKGNNIPTTIIKGTNTLEATLLYESKMDTLFVCMRDVFKRENYIKSMSELINSCDEVNISPTDTVKFCDIYHEPTFIDKIIKLFAKYFV